MRWAVVPVLVTFALSVASSAAADEVRPAFEEAAPVEPAPHDVWRDAAAPYQPEVAASEPTPVKPAPRVEPAPAPTTPKPMPLPYGPAPGTRAPVQYYEGESCSGSGSTYDDGYAGDEGCSGETYETDVVYYGDDDDSTSAGDDDDDVVWGDDDDDDDDDDSSSDVDIEWGGDDDDDSESLAAPKLQQRLRQQKLQKPLTQRRPQSPFSRLALLGVLAALPLRRRFRSS